MKGKRVEIKHKCRLRERYDVSQGVLVSNKLVSICFDCGRSGAPLGLRCSWDEGLVLPKGAVYCKKCLKISNDEIITLPVVLACPMYVNDRDERFRQLVRAERRKRGYSDTAENMQAVRECVRLFEEM